MCTIAQIKSLLFSDKTESGLEVKYWLLLIKGKLPKTKSSKIKLHLETIREG